MSSRPPEPEEPEPEDPAPRETAMLGFFSDKELGEMYRECQNFKED